MAQYPPHPQINVDELCQQWQVLAKKTVIRRRAHDSTPSTTLNEGCGAQAYDRMELSEMAVFFANTGLGLESHRVHVMGQARVMLIVLWEAACADGLRRTGVANANRSFAAEKAVRRDMSRPVASWPNTVSSEPSNQLR